MAGRAASANLTPYFALSRAAVGRGVAKTYRINVARLRDLEQGRTDADSALLAYLTVIERDPETVRRALET